ncbi:short chain dehydrogenase/reductase [Nannizzia gypsea CBS 118893]|uniref:Short chain dehydrogenase/reductase n=1 Tax=Arthroderma gypseum (strain ATCC MYA-4604 / CBS 118893) TaxID=535722 RepID=E4V4E0_ARTGP|nr:short chain dehydrogenase/reductase [Nannizzia gypsea CBS 118893]EFR04864.1 short chain dehydrogenase/reductase [Nannizzia gypsea CBS 118893]
MISTKELTQHSLFDVKGFVAVVTGGGSGIGLMATQGLIAGGARVYIVSRRKEVLDEVAKKYSQTGQGGIIGIKADINYLNDVENLAKELEAKEPKGINILINNAGVTQEADKKSQVSSVDYHSADSVRSWLEGNGRDIWQQTLASNLTSHHFVTARLVPALDKGSSIIPGHSSSIINISSISGTVKSTSSGQFAYAASKAAFTHLSRQLAYTLYPLHENQKSKIEGAGHKFPAGMTAFPHSPIWYRIEAKQSTQVELGKKLISQALCCTLAAARARSSTGKQFT